MDEKRIILEEIRRINYISNYKLNETSVENKRHINERYGDGISALRDLAATREGAALLSSSKNNTTIGYWAAVSSSGSSTGGAQSILPMSLL